jgi:phage shock protein A
MMKKMTKEDVKAAEKQNDQLKQVEIKLTKQLGDLRGKVEEWKKGKTNVEVVDLTANGDGSVTTAKWVVDSMWEGGCE